MIDSGARPADRFEVLTHIENDGSHVLQDFFRGDQPPILGHKDQINDAMSADSVGHRPSV